MSHVAGTTICSNCPRCRLAWPFRLIKRPHTLKAERIVRSLIAPNVLLTPIGPRTRLVVATHPATSIAAPIGVTRDGIVYELFFTALPSGAFTPADVVALYLHRGAFEAVLADEDTE
jgi:hypothetical protein